MHRNALPGRALPWTGIVLVSVIWGSAWAGNQVLAEEVSPVGAGGLCYQIAAAGWALVWLARRLRPGHRGGVASHAPPPARSAERPTRHSEELARLGAGTVLGAAMLGLPTLLLLWTAHHGAGGWTPLVYAAMPLMLDVAAGGLRTSGIVALGAMFTLLNGSLPLGAERLVWALPLLMAVALQGWALTYARKHLQAVLSPAGLFAQFQTAALVLLAFGRLQPSHGAMTATHLLSTSSLIAAATLGLVVNAAGYGLYYTLLRSLEPAQLAVTQWLQPLVAIGESAWMLGRTPGWMMSVAGLVLVTCTILRLRDRPESGELRIA